MTTIIRTTDSNGSELKIIAEWNEERGAYQLDLNTYGDLGVTTVEHMTEYVTDKSKLKSAAEAMMQDWLDLDKSTLKATAIDNAQGALLAENGTGYSWMLEGIQDAQLADWSDSQIEAIVKQHAENHYDAVLIDDDLMRVALTRDEFVAACDTHSAVNYITRKRNEARSEAALETVLTAAEACEVYGLAEATVRQAINRGTLPARKSAETWLVLRADCDARWGKK